MLALIQECHISEQAGKTVAITEFIFCSGVGREGRGETDKRNDKLDNLK